MAIQTQSHPAVHAFETDDDFVVAIDLPAEGVPVQLDLRARSLTVRVSVPHHERQWRIDPDATGC